MEGRQGSTEQGATKVKHIIRLIAWPYFAWESAIKQLNTLMRESGAWE